MKVLLRLLGELIAMAFLGALIAATVIWTLDQRYVVQR